MRSIHGQNLINLFMQRRSSRSNCKSAKFNWIVYRRRSSGLGIEINATTPALASIPPRPCLAPQSSCVASRRLSSRSRSDIRRLSSHAVSLSNSLPQKDTRAPSPSPRGRHRFSHDSRAPTIKQSECALRSIHERVSERRFPSASVREARAFDGEDSLLSVHSVSRKDELIVPPSSARRN